MDKFNFFKSAWENRFAIIQIFIDYKVVLLLIWFVIGIFIIYFIAYINQSQRNFFSIIKSPSFNLPVAFLMLLVAVFIFSLRKEVAPPNDGKIYITITKFNNTIEARRLQDSIEVELEKWLPLAGNLVLKKKVILETVKNKEQAILFGKRKGLHYILFGQLNCMDNAHKAQIECEIIQIHPFKNVPLLGRFKYDNSFDLGEPSEIKKIIKEIVVKIIKIYDSNEFLSGSDKISMGTAIHGLALEAKVFNVGTNLVWGFNLNLMEEEIPFVSGRTDQNGDFIVSAYLYDSDGKNHLEIKENKIINNENNKNFSVRQIGPFMSIRDSYDRTLLQIRKNEKIEDLIEYIKKYHEKRNLPPLELKKISEIRDVNSFYDVTGEIYGKDGKPLAFMTDKRLLLFHKMTFGFPLDEGPQSKRTVSKIFEKALKEETGKYKSDIFLVRGSNQKAIEEFYNILSSDKLKSLCLEMKKNSGVGIIFEIDEDFKWHGAFDPDSNPPRIYINRKSGMNEADIGLSICKGILIKNGYPTTRKALFNDKRQEVTKDLNSFILNIPSAKILNEEGFNISKYFKKFLISVENNLKERKENLINKIPVIRTHYEALNLVRLEYEGQYYDDKKEIDDLKLLFKKKSPVAYSIAQDLIQIIDKANPYEAKGAVLAIYDCLSYFNSKNLDGLVPDFKYNLYMNAIKNLENKYKFLSKK